MLTLCSTGISSYHVVIYTELYLTLKHNLINTIITFDVSISSGPAKMASQRRRDEKERGKERKYDRRRKGKIKAVECIVGKQEMSRGLQRKDGKERRGKRRAEG